MAAINPSTKMSGGAPEMLTSSIGDYETQLTLHTPCEGSYKLLVELTKSWSKKFMKDKDTSKSRYRKAKQGA